ncbi:MAG: DUF2520 domain-containing protein [Cyclobacteriaceae bacterium]
MSKVAIIGFGNVGYHLAVRISKKHEVIVFGRTPDDELIKSIDDLDTSEFDFTILAIPDTAIKEVSDSLNTSDSIILHTSGSIPLDVLAGHTRTGVMYPLQTFSREKNIDFNSFPIFIEGSEETEKAIFNFTRSFSTDVRLMNSTNRAKLHLAAVFVSNFTNHLYHISDTILASAKLEFSDLQHLADETLKKAAEISPLKAQTGPAVRNDTVTMKKHLGMLENDGWKRIYELISEDIRKSQQ